MSRITDYGFLFQTTFTLLDKGTQPFVVCDG